MSRSRKHCNGSLGFTLMELMVVMIIVALVAAITTPLLAHSLGAITLRSEAKRIAASLRYARQQSIIRQVSHTVVLQPNSHMVVVTWVGDNSSGMSPWVKKSEFQLNEDIIVETAAGMAEDDEGNIAVSFFIDGSSSSGQIMVRDKRDRRIQVDIDLVTGIVTTVDG